MQQLVNLVRMAVLDAIVVNGPTPAKRERQLTIMARAGAALPEALAVGDISSPLRISHFLAQIAHESDGFCTTEEYASGAAYEGRADLGNIEPGDGVRFKGRGLIQLTGRSNYREAGAALGLDLEADPARALDAVVSVKIAVWYWTKRKLNISADRDDLVTVTRMINGGTNGLASRRTYLGRAKAAIGALEAKLIVPEDGVPATVVRGSRDEETVILLQNSLRAWGWSIAVDGDFGPATELAVRQFQTSHPALKVDGIVGPKTWRALLAMRPST